MIYSVTVGTAAPILDVRFEPFDGHRSLVVDWRPSEPPRARAVFFPAFGDEMNQSRRMVKLAAQSLAMRGIASTVFDLHGTGDSSADFSDASVTRWLADCRQVIDAAQRAESARSGQTTPILLVGCRLGVALASQASHWLPRPAAALIGWAPELQGKLQLSGMLRADKFSRMQRADAAGKDPKTQWAAGVPAMLAGYPISPTLAEELDAFDATRAPKADRALLIDLRLPSGEEPVQPAEPLRKHAANWLEQGVEAQAQAVEGPAFWNVSDLVDVPALVELTVSAAESAIDAARTGVPT